MKVPGIGVISDCRIGFNGADYLAKWPGKIGENPQAESLGVSGTMISVDILGFGRLELEHLVVDYNGTVAVDGRLLPGVAQMLRDLAATLCIHVITADTFGLAGAQLTGLPVILTVIPVEGQAEAKLDYVSKLGARTVVALGNGRTIGKC